MITLFTEDGLFQRALGHFRVAFANFPNPVDLSDVGFLGLCSRALARLNTLVQSQILQAVNDAIPSYQTDATGAKSSKTSSAGLDLWAFVLGLPSGVAGQFGRKAAGPSSGGAAVPGATLPAVLIPAGSTAKDSTGAITIKTRANVTTDGPPNLQAVSLVSVTTGAQANFAAGSVFTWSPAIAGLTSTFTLTQALENGTDRESDVDLLARILKKLQNPQKGGTAADYRFWGETATDIVSGEVLAFDRIYVYPLRDGLGSVDVVLTDPGYGTNRKPTAARIAQAQAFYDSVRPIGTPKVRALAPEMNAARGLKIRVTPIPSVAKNGLYLWDWDDLSSQTVILAHTANTITVGAVHLDLAAKFAAGKKPLISIQISTAGAPETPFVARVINIVGLVLTLDRNFVSEPTDTVDYFWAGSLIVAPIAERIRQVVRSLGPSRQSGTANPDDIWADVLQLEEIASKAQETIDTDGTRMVEGLRNFETGQSVKIGVFGFGFAANDFVPTDVRAGTNPELAYVLPGGIEVIR